MKSRNFTAVSWCYAHEKFLYTSRKRARGVARQHSPRKSVYRCTDKPAMWHVGGLPQEVRHGHVTRDDYYWRAS